MDTPDTRGPLSKLLGHKLPTIQAAKPITTSVRKLNAETLANGRVNEQPAEEATVLLAPIGLSMVIVARALTQFGMCLEATTDGRMRIAYSDLTRDEVMKLNLRNRRDDMHFTPSTGYCHNCSADLIEQYGKPQMAAGLNVTGCRKCHRSYVD